MRSHAGCYASFHHGFFQEMQSRGLYYCDGYLLPTTPPLARGEEQTRSLSPSGDDTQRKRSSGLSSSSTNRLGCLSLYLPCGVIYPATPRNDRLWYR